MRGATLAVVCHRRFISVSIHAPHAGRDCKKPDPTAREAVSIHAPRVGRDPIDTNIYADMSVSIHAPHAGRDCAIMLVDV